VQPPQGFEGCRVEAQVDGQVTGPERVPVTQVVALEPGPLMVLPHF
jgi:hypothetical protein